MSDACGECGITFNAGPRKVYCTRECQIRANNKKQHINVQNDPQKLAQKRSSHFLWRYGITLAQRDEMIAAQNNLCAICGGPPSGGQSLHVDHDHLTGAVREMLCGKCNLAIGLMNDDPIILRSAADYIEQGRT